MACIMERRYDVLNQLLLKQADGKFRQFQQFVKTLGPQAPAGEYVLIPRAEVEAAYTELVALAPYDPCTGRWA